MKRLRTMPLAALLLLAVLHLPAFSQAPLNNHLPANGVLGEPNFVTATGGGTSALMTNAFGAAVDPTTGKLFVADRNNSRVLRFSSTDKLVNGAAAEAVLGQPDFTTVTANTGGISASTMNLPVRVFVDNSGRLWVSDYQNRRILRFDNASTKANGAAADGVLGQPDFVTNSAGTTASKMNRTTGVFVDNGGRLWVGERDNNRVLRFDNAAGKANGAAADAVLGQPDFTTATSGVSASVMSGPFGVYVDAAGRLWVAEDGNSRLLRFDSAATKANGAAANGVLGQPDFVTNTYSTTQSQTGNLRGVYGDEQGRIYVADEGNSRVLIYANAAAKANGAPADNVLGQADFVSSSAPAPPTASSFAFPNSLFIDAAHNHLWVADAGNNRVLRFDLQMSGPTSVEDQYAAAVPTNFALSQNYPNPFNPGTTISFTMKRTQFASVIVYDMLGREVARLFEGTATANQQVLLKFNASSLPSGVYLYCLRSADVFQARKMILMK